MFEKLMIFLFGSITRSPIDWKNDPKTWAAHAAITCGLTLGSHLAFSNPWFGFGIGIGIYYMKEVKEHGNGFYPWRWKSWDSILDFVSPVIIGLLFCRGLV